MTARCAVRSATGRGPVTASTRCRRETHHLIDDADVLLVHVTAFNALMWDSGRTPTRVIEHGVIDPGVRWTGELERGLVVVNNLPSRGRRVGADIFERAR